MTTAFRLARLAARTVGRRRALAALVDVAWATRRAAYELAGEEYGVEFHNATSSTVESLLARALPPGASVLDLGCGIGRWSSIAARHASSVTGVDHDAASLAAARAHVPPDVELLLADVASDLTEVVGGRRFDLALLVHVLEHVDSPETVLRELHTVADRLLIELPDFEADPLNLVRRTLGRPFWWDADHVREFTEDALSEVLAHAGWRADDTYRRWGALTVLASRAR